MNVDEINKVVEELKAIQLLYGIGGVVFFVFFVIGGIILWKFLIKRAEKRAEEITDKKLKKFQAALDKEFVKYNTKHQKQIDAVQDFYQRFEALQSFVNFVSKGDKFTAQMHPKEEVELLARYRLQFMKSYSQNKILFPESLNHKIESLFPEIDTFLKDYIDGLMPTVPEEHIPDGEKNGVQLAGIWPMGKLEPTLEKMDEISKKIEQEFRKIYGTDEE